MGIGSYINMSYQKNLVKQVNDYYEHDLLTGLYNRNGFNNVFGKIEEEKKNSGIPVTIIMYDLDGLKAINDNFGHEEGDRAIATLAASVKKSCPEGAFNVRFGGDEIFSVIIGECEKDSIIKKIDASLDAYNETSGKDYRVLASYGIYNTVFDEDFNIAEALGIADKRMYEIKKEHHERYSMDVGSVIKKKKK
jgi:diguanylate cyclase (GGDEF)-like protein